jgi:hypothetical protein
MCPSEKKGAHMYYQDTDSFFINKDELPMIVEEFKKRYGRELIGKNLGQFHSDFSSRDGRGDVQHATECLFIRKKLYCCKLLMDDGSENITFRSKGIPPKVIEKEAMRRYPVKNINDAIFELYRDLNNGEVVELNLADDVPIFKFHKDFKIESLKEFKRTVKNK